MRCKYPSRRCRFQNRLSPIGRQFRGREAKQQTVFYRYNQSRYQNRRPSHGKQLGIWHLRFRQKTQTSRRPNSLLVHAQW